jgi:L-iditol 2-dehydrogenase
MKALVLKEYMQLVYEDVPKPPFADDEVLIQVMSCGICGSDVHGMDGSTGRRIPPVIMGHEASGVIQELGHGVKNWKIGESITFDSTVYPQDDWYTKKGFYNLSDNRQVLGVSCEEFKRDGAFADLVAVPQHILYRIPDNVSFDQAAMTEPAAVAMHAVNLSPVNKGDVAVVVGAGMIGLFVIQILKIRGCSQVIAIDISDNQLNMAKKFGADLTLDAANVDLYKEIYNLTDNRGADSAFEAVGTTVTVKTAIKSVRKGGSVTLIGNLSKDIEIPLQSVVTRQIRLQGSCAIAGEYPEVLQLIGEGKINVDAMLSATAHLSEGAEWFDRLYNKEPGLMKVVLNP